MGVRFLLANGLVVAGVAWMTMFAGLEVRAAEVLSNRGPVGGVQLDQLETQAALAPASPRSTAALASAYLDRDQPGLATAVIERAPRQVRERPEVAYLYARALFHRGRARDAFAVARDASEACTDTCPAWLVAKTARQVAFLEQLVAAGVDDPQDEPAATRAAYQRSTREVRVVAMR